MEPSEIVGTIQRHDQNACPEEQHVRGLAEVEAAQSRDEQIAAGEVEEAL